MKIQCKFSTQCQVQVQWMTSSGCYSLGERKVAFVSSLTQTSGEVPPKFLLRGGAELSLLVTQEANSLLTGSTILPLKNKV